MSLQTIGLFVFVGRATNNGKKLQQENKKSVKEASNTFHNIMAASVKGNPKPIPKKKAAKKKA